MSYDKNFVKYIKSLSAPLPTPLFPKKEKEKIFFFASCYLTTAFLLTDVLTVNRNEYENFY